MKMSEKKKELKSLRTGSLSSPQSETRHDNRAGSIIALTENRTTIAALLEKEQELAGTCGFGLRGHKLRTGISIRKGLRVSAGGFRRGLP
ncbi:hypothetical protein L1987_48617 [Smallanthus sonchifolius]|uniref:Uncharacterized protein n=1 Tax=Smallanthus sonchifolius TaxID=185202 RepID=A0ACB9FS59_9ASTR|nr:hypothetical protein L1987_48617 [Smallanthus sonchifolius]